MTQQSSQNWSQELRNFLRDCRRTWSGQLTLLMAAYAILFLLWQYYQWGGPALRVALSDAAFLPVALAAGLVAFRAAGRPGLEPVARRGWRLIGLAFLLYWAGDLLWFCYEAVLGIDPFPSVADLFYLAQYPVLLAGVLSLSSGHTGPSDWAKFWLDAATLLVSGWAATWFLVLGPTAEAGFGSLEGLLATAYPVGDLLVFFGIVVILFRRRDGGGFGAHGLLALSLALIFFGDLAYGRLSLANQYQGGDWPDSLWMLGQACMVLAAQYRYFRTPEPLASEGQPAAPPGRLPILLPYVGVAVTYLLLLFGVRLDRTGEGLLLGAVTVTLTVMARQVLVLRENSRLLTTRAELLDEIRRSEVRFRSLVQHSSDVIAVVEAGAVIRYISPSLRGVLGYSPDHLVGLPLTGLLHPADAAETTSALSEPGSRVVQCRLRHRDGTWLYTEATVNNLLHDPDVAGVVLNLRDVTERKALEEQLTHQAFHDPLTDLANRALLLDRIAHALIEQRRRGEPLAVLFLDLDGFKTVNDSLGHAAGDELLGQVARRLTGCVRAMDTVARVGGDEFAVLMEGADEAAATQVAERFAHALSHPFRVQGKDLFVGSSTGIAISRGGESADELLRNADVAMYSAKGQGKGQYAIFQTRMHADALQRLELEGDLRTALEQQQFVVHYQPVVQLATGEIAGVEALVRWQHPQRGTVAPGEFIPLAEETGLILPLGRWVLREACRQVAAWQRRSPDTAPLHLSANLSARQLQMGPELIADVAAILRETELAPGSLTLEITETVLMRSTGEVVATLTGLKELGIRLAIDDFGTGYSSLSYLRGFPVDIVKIDRAFVDVAGRGFRETALVRGIIDLSHALGLTTVAEGIEHIDQAAELEALGCPLGQGYYFYRPGNAEQVSDWLTAGRLPMGPTER